MRLPGKTRQFPFLAVTTLSVAAVGVSAPAWVPNALAGAEHATTTSTPPPQEHPQRPQRPEHPQRPGHPQRPTANSAVAGYVLSGDTAGYHSYDSAASGPDAVTVTPSGTGVFKVDFARLSTVARPATARVTAFNAADNCVLDTVRRVGSDLEVIVQCVRVATGNSDRDAEFDLVVTRAGRKSLRRRSASPGSFPDRAADGRYVRIG